jgi:RNA polymerase sigma-70 factor (ECF subfamily)
MALLELPMNHLSREQEVAYIACLVEHVNDGDEEALEELCHVYGPLVFAVIRRITCSDSFADQALKRLHFEVRAAAKTYDVRRGPFEAWLLGGVRRTAFRLAREHTELPLEADERIDLRRTTPALSSAAMEERRAVVDMVINSMPENQRSVLILAYFEGLPAEQIAERISVPVAIVRELFRRGLARLGDVVK